MRISSCSRVIRQLEIGYLIKFTSKGQKKDFRELLIIEAHSMGESGY